MSGEIHPVDLRVGQNVRRVRMRKGFSQTALATSVGITFQQIQKYEKGTNRISASMMHDIAKTLDVDILSLFTDASADIDDKGFHVPENAYFINKLDLKIIDKIARIDNVEIKNRIINLIDAISSNDLGYSTEPESEVRAEA